MRTRNIITYVNSTPPGIRESLRMYEKRQGKKYKILLLRDTRLKESKREMERADIVVSCDFSKPEKLVEALLPYQDKLLAITCRGDIHIPSFSKVIPHVPYLRTPTTESLEWSINKVKMRNRLRLFDASITPRYARVKENTKAERARVAEKVRFPMVIKPADLAESLLVSVCYHEEELEKTLRNVFRKVRKTYAVNKRDQEPVILAEEYMEGDMYSVDAYVNSRGDVYFCPLVRVITGKNIGHDDFYNYMHMTPTGLKRATVAKAEDVAETAIRALGLRSTTAHVELMKIDDEWKIIEVGPRIGGFRHKLHTLSCDINHTLNDILIRIPKKPFIPKKCKGYAATLKWFPKTEGVITELKGIKKIRTLKSFNDIVVNKKVGDRARFAKNGGKAVFNVTLYNESRPRLLADIRRVEQSVNIKIRAKNGKRS